MSMDHAAAERWVVISATGVAGMYAYRRLTESTSTPPTLKEIAGAGALPQLGAWATAWGFTFLVVAVIAEASPELGGAFAILILVGAAMANAASIFGDVGKQETKGSTAPTAKAAASSSTAAPSTAPARQTAGNASTGGLTS